MAQTQKTLTVHIHREDDDSLWAEVEELPGCFASGFSTDELNEALAEAIGQYLSTPENQVTVKLADSSREVESVNEQKVLVC